MDDFGITLNGRNGTSRYRTSGVDLWPLDEAAELAISLRDRAPRYVTVGNGEHEFRMWTEGTSSDGSDFGPRHASWYCDAEIAGHWWQYRPMADADDWEAVELLGEIAAGMAPIVTRIRWGRSDGTEEHESETQAD